MKDMIDDSLSRKLICILSRSINSHSGMTSFCGAHTECENTFARQIYFPENLLRSSVDKSKFACMGTRVNDKLQHEANRIDTERIDLERAK